MEKIGTANVVARARSVCAPLRERARHSAEHYNCTHGMGHGFMGAFASDVFASLRGCDALAERWERHNCHGGVFMENLSAIDNPERPPTALRPQEPLYPCTAVARRYREPCFDKQTSYALYVTDSDYAQVFRLCARTEPRLPRRVLPRARRRRRGRRRQAPVRCARPGRLAQAPVPARAEPPGASGVRRRRGPRHPARPQRRRHADRDLLPRRSAAAICIASACAPATRPIASCRCRRAWRRRRASGARHRCHAPSADIAPGAPRFRARRWGVSNDPRGPRLIRHTPHRRRPRPHGRRPNRLTPSSMPLNHAIAPNRRCEAHARSLDFPHRDVAGETAGSPVAGVVLRAGLDGEVPVVEGESGGVRGCHRALDAQRVGARR